MRQDFESSKGMTVQGFEETSEETKVISPSTTITYRDKEESLVNVLDSFQHNKSGLLPTNLLTILNY